MYINSNNDVVVTTVNLLPRDETSENEDSYVRLTWKKENNIM
jgi:hypothetical protein